MKTSERFGPVRVGGAASLLIAAATLSACAGFGAQRGEPRSATGSGEAARTSSAQAATAGGVAAAVPSTGGANRPGAYYDNDGPPDTVPPNLAATPDATPRYEPPAPRTNRPYVVFGKNYVPLADAKGWRERGMASWYGRKFHGQKTSSGEPYDMFAMTAAHPTLPIPSYVRVTNAANGKSVIVRVNDRGPFLQNRVIDLSYTAAYKLGYLASGSTAVELEVIDVPDILATLTAAAPDAQVAQSASALPAAPATAPAAAPAPGTGAAVAASAADLAAAGVPSKAETARAPVVALTMPAPAQGAMAAASTVTRPSAAASSVAPQPARASASAVEALANGAPSSNNAVVIPERLIVETVALSNPAEAPAAAAARTRPGEAAPAGAAQAGPAGAPVYLQLAAFGSRDNADSARVRIRSMLEWLPEPINVVAQGNTFRLHAGPFADRAVALAIAERIRRGTEIRAFAIGR